METRIKVITLELSEAWPKLDGLEGYARARLYLLWAGEPLGMLDVPVFENQCDPKQVREEILEKYGNTLLAKLLRASLRQQGPEEGWNAADLTQRPLRQPHQKLPSISVAVCTRDRTEDLVRCLNSLQRLEHAPAEILVIDNAPSTTATHDLISYFFPDVRYIIEPRPGLDFARNRAILEATGEVIAFTDDDVVVDSKWTRALASLFASDSQVMAATGLVIPHELETKAQQLFEDYGGFSRGFERKWYRPSAKEQQSLAEIHGGTGKFGTGANMAFRRSLFAKIGLFDIALDVGTPTNGGGDLEMFFRVLKNGCALVYEPAAMVRHRHRRRMEKLATQIANNGIGFYSHLVRSALAYPEERRGFLRLGLWWFRWWNVRRLAQSFFKPTPVPRHLIVAELLGSIKGLTRYQKALANRDQILQQFGPQPELTSEATFGINHATRVGVAVREIDLRSGLRDICDVIEFSRTRVFLSWNGKHLGKVDIENNGCPISAEWLGDEAIKELGLNLLHGGRLEINGNIWSTAIEDLRKHFDKTTSPANTTPKPMRVSVVVATCDRPDDLRNCLASLSKQVTRHEVEIVVVDNKPASGLTSEVVAEFPGVRLVREQRVGLSYARNTGFRASSGEILVTTDDDVVMPANWLENLVAPFARNDVMLVTGNVLPLELETASQIEFENYGGLGRGFGRREYNRAWFYRFNRRSAPTWEIGATANAAVRASALQEAGIGCLEETLGAGTPTGCSEDTYLFYKILKAGHTIIYEPAAMVWHKHRRTNASLRRQIFNYSKGHAAYHLLTFLREGDGRGLVRIWAELPRYYLDCIIKRLTGRGHISLRRLALEIAGNLAGPFALLHSVLRCRAIERASKSSPCEKAAASSGTAGLSKMKIAGGVA